MGIPWPGRGKKMTTGAAKVVARDRMKPHEGMDGRLSKAEVAELVELGYTADEISENEGAFAANRGNWE